MFFISAERLEKKWKKWLKKMYEVRVIYYCDSVKVGTAMTAEYAVDIAFDFANRLEENGYKWLEVYGLHFYSGAEYRRFKNNLRIAVGKVDENGKLLNPVYLDD